MATGMPPVVVASALLCLLCFVPGPGGVCGSTAANTTQELESIGRLRDCVNMTSRIPDLCAVTEACCMPGVDQTGWIAAAVGWSLAFLVLIVSCACQLRSVQPQVSKRMRLREGLGSS